MYFSGKLTIDPSQLTEIKKVKPQKAFKKMLFHLTAGLVANKEEHETFTAVAILQQLNGVFRSLKIDNIVRLAHDDIDFYLDTEGKEGDLKEAFEHYDLSIGEAMSTVFEKLFLVLEHQEKSFYYLIEININRTHKVGAYPIEITINGLLKDLKADENTSVEEMKTKMGDTFSSQENYDSYVRQMQLEFDTFLTKLKLTLKKFMSVDDIQTTSKQKMIAPKEKIQNRKSFSAPKRSGNRNTYHNDYDPIYDDYYGANDWLYYSVMWSSMTNENHIHIHDVAIYNDEGDILGAIGSEPVDAGDFSLLDEETNYDEAMTGANDFMEIEHDDYSADDDDSNSDSSWFDSDAGDSDFGGSDDSSSCSSCSSCDGD